MAKSSTHRRRRWSLVDLAIYAVMGLALIGAGIASFIVISAVRDLPALANLEPKPSESSIIYDRDGKVWTELHSTEHRIPVNIEDVPEHVKNAVLAAEDHRFYYHKGVDIKSIMRALVSNLLGNEGLQGGSTITQQLAKTAFLESSRTLKRKVQDAIVATLLERKYTKDEILEMYLNIIPFGRGAYGIEAAARAFFGKSVSDLTVDEAALLAGMIRGPYLYDPADNPKGALTRRNTVLDQMAAYGFITKEDAERYKAKPIATIPVESQVVPVGGYFLDYVLKQLLSRYPSEQVYGGGLRVYTTYSPQAQKAAEDAISQVLDKDFPYQGKESLQAAAVVMDSTTGHILAMVGGRKHEGMLGWNRAVDARRQPGSAFKPLAVYIPAIEAGMGPWTVIDDSPVTWVDPVTKEQFSPQNYTGTFKGLVSMRTAVRESLNVVAAKVQDMVGIQKSLETAEKLGITTLVKTPTPDGRSDYTRALSLGGLTYGVSPLDMAVAYATIANGGVRVEPIVITRVEDKNGNILEEHQPRRTLVISEETAFLMTNMLQDVLTKPGGTGRAAYFGRPAAGKTGTTSDWKDAWFCGFVPSTVGVVWVGFDQEKTMEPWKITGGSYPAVIWAKMMSEITKGQPVEDFRVPETIKTVTICQKTGLLPSPYCPREDIVTEYFPKDRIPQSTCTYHLPKGKSN